MHQYKFYYRGFIIGVVVWWMLAFQPAPLWAAVFPFHGDMALPLESQTTLRSDTAHVGDPFQALLTTSVCQKGDCLPAGTVFSGAVIKVKHAHRFHRPGVLVLRVSSIQLPNHLPLPLNPALGHANTTVIHDRKATTWRYALKKQLPGIIGGLTFPYLLTQFTTLGPKRIITATLALGVLADIGQEVVWPTFQGTSIPKRVALGVLGTFYIPDIIDTLHKQPEAALTKGQPIQLKLPARTVQLAFNQLEESPPLPQASALATPPLPPLPETQTLAR